MRTQFYPANKRGHVEWDWLSTYHSFSFGSFYNPDLMGFGLLRVVNDDTIAPGAGFGMHPHQNMEIITLPLSGAVHHRDDAGGEGVIPAGSVQVMSAGSGVFHSEVNASPTDPLRLFQIWIEPKKLNIQSRYAEKTFGFEKKNVFELLVSNDGRRDSLAMNQDAFLSIGHFAKGTIFQYAPLEKGHAVFLMVVEGWATLAETNLHRRDAIGMWDFEDLSGMMKENGQILIIEVPLK